MPRIYTRIPARLRFWALVVKTDDCWLWTGAKKPGGYGSFVDQIDGKRTGWNAHRFAYTDAVGPIPDGMSVLHRCDNRPCVRPDHLFLGTQADNIHDAQTKGRLWIPSLDYRTRSHCKRGHEFTGENTFVMASGTLVCRACSREKMRRHRAKAHRNTSQTRSLR